MKIIIKNGVLVSDTHAQHADLLIEDGKIAGAGDFRGETADRVYDAEGCFVLPGGIDPHVHFALEVAGGEVSADDFSAGTRAALLGGTTTVLDFVTPEPGQGLEEALVARRAVADPVVLGDYGLHMSITEWRDSIPAEMARSAELGASSFKTYLAYKQGIGLEDRDFLRVLEAAAREDWLVTAHCEHGDAVDYLREKLIREGKTGVRWHPRSRPALLEEEAVTRAIALAGLFKTRLYIVHLSTAGGLEAAARARAGGGRVYLETCPHYLLLDQEAYEAGQEASIRYTMSPPLRPAEHLTALWEGIESGEIDTLATDHCPFSLAQKKLGWEDFTKIPNGVAGVEERLALLWASGVGEARISAQRFVELTSARAARIFGLYPRKGSLMIGADADLVIWDPVKSRELSARTQASRADQSIWEGFKLAGGPRQVFLRGQLAVDRGEVLLQPGSGRYLARLGFETGSQNRDCVF